MTEKVNRVLIVHESLNDSIKKDTFTLVTFMVMLIPGIYFGSAAMQIIGAIMFLVHCITRLGSTVLKHAHSPEEARAKLELLMKEKKE